MKFEKIISIVLVVLIIVGGYVFIQINQLANANVGKVLEMTLEDTDAEEINAMLTTNDFHGSKWELLDRGVLEKLCAYMSDNNYVIAAGEYSFSQTVGIEELIGILKFKSE